MEPGRSGFILGFIFCCNREAPSVNPRMAESGFATNAAAARVLQQPRFACLRAIVVHAAIIDERERSATDTALGSFPMRTSVAISAEDALLRRIASVSSRLPALASWDNVAAPSGLDHHRGQRGRRMRRQTILA